MLSILTSLAHCVDLVSFCHFLPGYKHVALLAPRVGDREFVEDHNNLLQVMVHVMKLEVCTAGIPPRASLNQAVDGCGHPRGGHLVLIWSK